MRNIVPQPKRRAWRSKVRAERTAFRPEFRGDRLGFLLAVSIVKRDPRAGVRQDAGGTAPIPASRPYQYRFAVQVDQGCLRRRSR